MTNSLSSLQGLIERVTFHNVENGFCVLRVNVKGHRDLITVVGSCAAVTPGEWVQAHGLWHQDRQHGQQFKASTLTLTPPTTLEGVQKYLASGLIKGIGPVYAAKLVKAFGEDVFTVIEQDPTRLQSIPGIGPFRAQKIISGWTEQKAVRHIMLFLHSHGVSTTRAVRIYRTYGDEAIQRIQENPYRLAEDIHGIGFLSADKIAEQIGIERSSPLRACAGLSYVLLKATEDGQCGLPLSDLILRAQELLQIEAPLLESALQEEVQRGRLIQDTSKGTLCVFLRGLYTAEKIIAERLKDLMKRPCPWPSIHTTVYALPQEDFQLSPSQHHALRQVLSNKVSLITGGPGVGKTTLLKSILTLLSTHPLRLGLCAPTGRAAKRLREATGHEAKTLHRLLEVNPRTGGFRYNESAPLPYDVIIVDEVSMVDVLLMNALLKAIPSAAALILVGDPDQLPSVGPGQVLGDLVASQAIPRVHLTDVFRQAAHSQIISVAYSINKGIMPPLKGHGPTSDFFFLDVQDPEEALETIVSLVHQRLPTKMGFSARHDIQVLCPMTRGGVGTRSLNIELQKRLNPPQENSLQKFGWTYAPGDKVIQVVNNYDKDVYNGDIGFIQRINTEEGEITITFEDREVLYDSHELDEIALAYALTIHKSQGSEYPVVIIPLLMTHYTMLQRNLIYTGITRGKKLVILVGQKQALAIATQNHQAQKRWSTLEKWLRV